MTSRKRTLYSHTRAIRHYSSKDEAQLATLLKDEIKHEQQVFQKISPPNGYKVSKEEGSKIYLSKSFEDGAIVEVSFDLSGSVERPFDENEGDELNEQEAPQEEDGDEMHARPEVVIKIFKPQKTKDALVFTCSFPPAELEKQMERDASLENHPTLSIDSVSVDNPQMGDYFVYSDLLDDDLYQRFTNVLMARGIDRHFQDELQKYCTSQEHSFYMKFLQKVENIVAL